MNTIVCICVQRSVEAGHKDKRMAELRAAGEVT
jgi:hypothetical protein